MELHLEKEVAVVKTPTIISYNPAQCADLVVKTCTFSPGTLFTFLNDVVINSGDFPEYQ